MELFSGALPGAQELLSAHHSCSPDLPEKELLSLTQTHSPDPAEIALQEFEAQGQVSQLEGTWHFKGRETEAQGLFHYL